jgi:hypothetical protein
LVEEAYDLEEGGFSDSGFASDGDEVSFFGGEVEAVEDGFDAEALAYVCELDQGCPPP